MSVNKYDKVNNRLIKIAGNGGGSGSGGIRYDEETDTVQLFYDGEWVDWKTAGLVYPVGSVTEFFYTGEIVPFTIPASGNWKIEAWGGKGGSTPLRSKAGGAAAYMRGTKYFNSDDIIYIVVGDAGGEYQTNYTGYNGGTLTADSTAGGGGGATHISINDGNLLKDTPTNDLIIVAAGGGGAGRDGTGGNGGLTGSGGSSYTYKGVTATGGGGASQSGGGSAGTSNYTNGNVGSYGAGGSAVYNSGGGGGGGLYGGGSGAVGSSEGWIGSGGGGGSSYFDASFTDTYHTTDTNIQGKVVLTYLGRA